LATAPAAGQSRFYGPTIGTCPTTPFFGDDFEVVVSADGKIVSVKPIESRPTQAPVATATRTRVPAPAQWYDEFGFGPQWTAQDTNKPDKSGVAGNPKDPRAKAKRQPKTWDRCRRRDKPRRVRERERAALRAPRAISTEHTIDQLLPSKQPVPPENSVPTTTAAATTETMVTAATTAGAAVTAATTTAPPAPTPSSGDDDDDDDDDSGSSDDEAMASSDSDEAVRPTTKRPATRQLWRFRRRPSGKCDELRYALFQALGYYFTVATSARNSLGGRSAAEHGTPDASGAHGAGQRSQDPSDIGGDPTEGQEKPKQTPLGTGTGVAVNPDQWKNPNPNAADKPSIKSGFTCRACRCSTRS